MSHAPTIRFLDRTTPPHIATLILIAGIGALNMSVFLPSLHRMALYFHADYAVMQLAVSGYLAATAVLQVAIGPISDRFGRRPVLIGALALFTLASLGAVVAPSVGWFLAFRMLQASVATGLVLSRAIVRDLFPPAQSASQIGYVTMGMAVVPMLGPALGGLLEQIWDWHATFLFLAIAGAGVLVLVIADNGETLAGPGMSFAEQLRGYPALLASRRFWGYVVCAAFGSGAFFALLGAASLIAGEVFALSPLWTGLALGSPAIGYAFGNYLSGRHSVRIGIDRMALAGMLVSATGMALSIVVTLAGLVHPVAFFGFCVFLGVGNGLMLPSATAGALSVRPELAGTAAGLSGAIMIGGGAVMSAVAGALQANDPGTMTLQVIMLATTLGGVAAILFVMRRARQLGL